jgi:hypothetical protein
LLLRRPLLVGNDGPHASPRWAGSLGLRTLLLLLLRVLMLPLLLLLLLLMSLLLLRFWVVRRRTRLPAGSRQRCLGPPHQI